MIYLTTNTNKGIFLQRFRNVGLNEDDTLIIIGDTGLSTEEGYEALNRLAWFKDQAYNVFVVSLKDNFNEDLGAILDDGDEGESNKAVLNLYGGRVYVIKDIRFLILNETTNLETVSAEVDYVLLTNLELLKEVKDKIKYKHAYVGECKDVPSQETNITILSENIIEIQREK